ncbi:MAG TPA: DUF456 domain-containing protein [Pirellulales bacterium]
MATTIVWAILFCLLLAVGWVMTVLALPGNWLIVAAAALYAWLVPPIGGRLNLGWQTVAALAVLAVIGELVELLAASRGVRQAGGSRGSAVLALLGSIAGATVGIFVGVPIPVVGSLVAAVLFAGIGAALGAMAGESLLGRSLTESHEVGWAAFRGRLLGTLAKILVGSVMVAVALCALVFA